MWHKIVVDNLNSSKIIAKQNYSHIMVTQVWVDIGSADGLLPDRTKPLPKSTRTTRTPAFWGYPPPPHDYPYHWVILDPKSKEDKVKISNFWILKRALYATHLLKLLDKMCKYEMDPMSIVEDTERTRFCPQTDRRTDRQTDRRTDGQGDTSIPPFQLRWSGGIMMTFD